MKTKRWPTLIIVAYFVINILLVLGLSRLLLFNDFKGREMLNILPFALIVAGVILICQLFLFSVKIDVIENKPTPKRKITFLSILFSLLLATLTFTAFIILFFVSQSKDAGVDNSYELLFNIFLFLLFFGSWIFWAYVFLLRYYKNIPGEFLRKTVSALMIGSVLELLVAIPSHIIFRNRGDCCAPIYSYFGIVMGTSILLFAFGPGIIFLYLKRISDKKSKQKK